VESEYESSSTFGGGNWRVLKEEQIAYGQQSKSELRNERTAKELVFIY